MIEIKELKTLEDFQAIKKGDILACEFNRNIHEGRKSHRFGVYEVVENKANATEIILNKKYNTYFNYSMFVNHGSILESAVLISNI